MGIISRLLMVMYVIVVTVALIAIGGASLNIIDWQSELTKIINRQETQAAVVVMILAGMCLLHAAVSGKKVEEILTGDEVELQSGVKITIPALTSVVERAAIQVAGVREAKAYVTGRVGEVPIKIEMDVVLAQGYSVPEVSAEINSAVSGALLSTIQISGIKSEIRVTEVTHAIISRERRVV